MLMVYALASEGGNIVEQCFFPGAKSIDLFSIHWYYFQGWHGAGNTV
jgi:hypothetical protein